MSEYEQARREMVRTQIEARGQKEQRMLAAMTRVERHLFIPEASRNQAYGDHPVKIGEGQTISQPYIVALMTELLGLSRKDKVLEIGTGSGYQAAILGELCDNVYTIEIVEPLGLRAAELLKRLGYDNIKVKIGDGYEGWPEYAPFNAIIVTCAPDNIPPPLLEQLAEGGRMVIPVGVYPNQVLRKVTKKAGRLYQEDVTGVLFVPMTGKAQE